MQNLAFSRVVQIFKKFSWAVQKYSQVMYMHACTTQFANTASTVEFLTDFATWGYILKGSTRLFEGKIPKFDLNLWHSIAFFESHKSNHLEYQHFWLTFFDNIPLPPPPVLDKLVKNSTSQEYWAKADFLSSEQSSWLKNCWSLFRSYKIKIAMKKKKLILFYFFIFFILSLVFFASKCWAWDFWFFFQN